MTLLLLQYNNYFNRVIKKTDLEGYLSHKHKVVPDVSFNPNDGVETTQIINWTENFTPDYCVIVKDNNEIDSRWFVTEATRTRNGQYNINLRRDLLADYNNSILYSPCFVEKGWVSDSNPLIYNQEDFSCNQIKRNEALLYDESQCSWLAIYYDLKSKSELTGTGIELPTEDYIDIPDGKRLSEWWMSDLVSTGYRENIKRELVSNYFINSFESAWSVNAYYQYRSEYGLNDDAEHSLNKKSLWKGGKKGADKVRTSGYLWYEGIGNRIDYEEPLGIEQMNDLIMNDSNLGTLMSQKYVFTHTLSEVLYWNQKIVKDTVTNKYYKIKIHSPVQSISDEKIDESHNIDLYNNLTNRFFNYPNNRYIHAYSSGDTDWHDALSESIVFRVSSTYYRVEITEISVLTKTYHFDFSDCEDLQDQPFGLLCIPFRRYDNNPIRFDYEHDQNERLPLKIAQELAKKGVGTSGPIYDIQLLPYCPVYLPYTASSLQIGGLDNSRYSYVYDESNTPAALVLHPITNKLTKQVNIATRMIRDYRMILDDNKKFENQCTFYRLCSPNYSGQFEFNRAKLDGALDWINIDLTYKPYSPYIHVNPFWNGLYGDDFNDARGLVCGGDFSISVATNAWEEYKLQNKNYQEIFNRQIENMDTTYAINREAEKSNMGINAISGLVKGAIGGALTGGVGSVVGAVTGVGTGFAKGAVSLNQNKQLYQENRDYTIDQHNYQLGNIQALPDCLTKVDSYTNNNKVFPFLERYTCTDEEREIFLNKLKYEGMTVNSNDILANFINPNENETFIRGKLIRINNVPEDSHALYAIYEEVNKGFYITGGTL